MSAIITKLEFQEIKPTWQMGQGDQSPWPQGVCNKSAFDCSIKVDPIFNFNASHTTVIIHFILITLHLHRALFTLCVRCTNMSSTWMTLTYISIRWFRLSSSWFRCLKFFRCTVRSGPISFFNNILMYGFGGRPELIEINSSHLLLKLTTFRGLTPQK